MQHPQFRTFAHELVRTLPQDLIHDLIELERRGLLEDTLNRALSRILLARVASGLMADVVRMDVVPLLRTTVPSVSRMSNNLMGARKGQVDLALTGNVSDGDRCDH